MIVVVGALIYMVVATVGILSWQYPKRHFGLQECQILPYTIAMYLWPLFLVIAAIAVISNYVLVKPLGWAIKKIIK